MEQQDALRVLLIDMAGGTRGDAHSIAAAWHQTLSSRMGGRWWQASEHRERGNASGRLLFAAERTQAWVAAQGGR